jgi:hypothetical protein
MVLCDHMRQILEIIESRNTDNRGLAETPPIATVRN